MKWISTRGASPPVPFIDALFAGTAPDGGLYMPERFDPLPAGDAGGAARRRPRRDRHRRRRASAAGRDHRGGAARRWSRDALDFPIPLVQVTDRVWALELFHGPTLAFKDVGARVQARLLHHFTDGTPLTILVATSGDTGSAVAQAFHRVPDTRVVVLYPEGQVSDVQEAQMASLGDNITAVAVRRHLRRLPAAGQAGVCRRRAAHARVADAGQLDQPGAAAAAGLLLLPAGAAARRAAPIVSVPSGNFGNLTAGLIAKRLGLPVRRFVAATNVNDAVPAVPADRAVYEPRPSVRTVANAMDVGAPSNFERMQALYGDDLEALRRDVVGLAFDDATGRGGDRRRLPRARLPARSARRHRAGWRCSDALRRPSRDAHGRVPGDGAPGQVPRSRGAGDRRRRCRCRRRWPRRWRRPRHCDADARPTTRRCRRAAATRRRTPMPPLDTFRPNPAICPPATRFPPATRGT